MSLPAADTAAVPPTKEAATGRQIAKGAAWMMLFKLLDKCVGLASTLILARLLVPADFGLVAMAMAVVAFTQLLSAFGFDSALIQRQTNQRHHYDTAWTFNVIAGCFIAIVLVLVAIPAGSFYRDARLANILFVLAAGSFFGSFENIGTVAFRRDLDFRSEFRFLLAKRLVSFAVTVGAAFALRSYWALIVGVVTGRLASVVISYMLHPYRPRLSLEARAELFSFSKWIFISSLISFLHNRSTDFILGRAVGPHALGLYSIASEIAAMPSTELIAPLNRAVYPAYSRLKSDVDALRSRFLDVFSIICVLGFPVSLGLYAVSEPAIRVVLGEKWMEAVPVMRVFVLVGLLSALMSNLFLVMMALGRPRAATLVSGAQLAVSLPLVVWASLQYGVTGAAWAHLTVAVIGAFFTVGMFTRILGMDLRLLWAAAWRPMVASLLMVVSTIALDNFMSDVWAGRAAIWRLAFLMSFVALSYACLLLSIWSASGRPKGAESQVLGFLSQRQWPWSASAEK